MLFRPFLAADSENEIVFDVSLLLVGEKNKKNVTGQWSIILYLKIVFLVNYQSYGFLQTYDVIALFDADSENDI